MRADVDEAGHQHRALADESAAPDDRTGHRAEARLTELTRTTGREFGGHLVPPIGAAGAARDLGHVVQAEREQHGLLEPLVDAPAACALWLGHTRRAGVELRKSLTDRLTPPTLGLAELGTAHRGTAVTKAQIV